MVFTPLDLNVGEDMEETRSLSKQLLITCAEAIVNKDRPLAKVFIT
jgi:hypothetical protein